MKTPLKPLILLALGALALPGAAGAKVVEIGTPSGSGELPAPSCPSNPCFAVSRTTGYQAKVGPDRKLYRVPADGRIVAWSIRLAQPNAKQLAFFRDRLGGASQAGLTILRSGKKLYSRVVAQSPIEQLEPYFGQSVQFPLEQSIPVRKNQLVGLTVPTWAPALAIGMGRDTSWRASRGKGKCDDTETQTAQTTLRQRTQYRCLYQRVRLAYSATLVTDPVPSTTKPQDGDTNAKPRSGSSRGG